MEVATLYLNDERTLLYSIHQVDEMARSIMVAIWDLQKNTKLFSSNSFLTDIDGLGHYMPNLIVNRNLLMYTANNSINTSW